MSSQIPNSTLPSPLRRRSPKEPRRIVSTKEHRIDVPRAASLTNDETSDQKIDPRRPKFKFHSLAKSILHSLHWRKRTTDDVRKRAEVGLCEAARKGEWKAAAEIEKNHPGILSTVISKDRNETALHIATRFNKVGFVENLVKTKLTKQDLASINSYGNTALCIAASLGALDVAELMVLKHNDLIHIRGARSATPVLIAARYRRKSMVEYLLNMTPIPSLKIDDQMELLLGAISADYYDIALVVLKWNESLALKQDINGDTPLHIMARKSNAIDNRWFRCIFKKTRMQIKANEMVAKMWRTVKSSESSKDKPVDFILRMLHEAARVGNVEFLAVLLHANPELLRIIDNNGKSIFHVAVENRQESVFNLIYDMKLFKSDDLLYYFDEEKISLLELAAKRADPTHLDRITGAVFQMHSELLWFKEVENIVKLTARSKQKGEQTAHKIFTEQHSGLKEEGEKWVKKTANSCMLVATLIVTVVFAAAFTVPGGKREDKGSPILVEQKWFTVFVISDGIAMISSSTSLLLFLSILTSSCAESDFLFWLPLELAYGIGFLFVSVLSTVMAFGATFFLYYDKDKTSLPLLIIGMATLPIFWFCVLQWKLWARALVSLHATTVSCWLRNRKTRSILQSVIRGVFVH